MFSTKIRGLLLVTIATFLWATLAIAGRLTVVQADTISIIIIRLIFAIIILSIILLVKKPKIALHRREIPLMALHGLISVALFHTSFFFALERISASVAVVLLYVSPFIVLLFSMIFFKERLTRLKVLGICMTLLGCLFVVEVNGLTSVQLLDGGILFGLLAAFGYACFTLFSKHFINTLHPLVVIWYSLLFGLFFLLFIRHPKDILQTVYTTETLLLILYMALVPTIIAYILYLKGLCLMEASRASIITTLEPVFALIMAALILQERLTQLQLLGSFMIVSAVLLIGEDRIRREKSISYPLVGRDYG